MKKHMQIYVHIYIYVYLACDILTFQIKIGPWEKWENLIIY